MRSHESCEMRDESKDVMIGGKHLTARILEKMARCGIGLIVEHRDAFERWALSTSYRVRILSTNR